MAAGVESSRPLAPESMRVTPFGNGVFADVVKAGEVMPEPVGPRPWLVSSQGEEETHGEAVPYVWGR